MFSIVIPFYNRSDYLPQAVESILKQSYQDFEVIIVDDGSTDPVDEVLKTCVGQSPERIRFVRQENAGAGAARNTGVKMAKGDYIAFLDADDQWEPTYLQKTYDALQDDNIDWVCTASKRLVVDAHEKAVEQQDILTGSLNDSEVYARLLKEDNVIGGPSQVVLKKHCLEKVGLYREDLPVREDWEMWLRLAKHQLHVKRINEPLYIYKIRGNSITKTGKIIGLTSAYKIFRQYSRDAFAMDHQNRHFYAEKLWNIARHVLMLKSNNFDLFIKCVFFSQVYEPSFRRIANSINSMMSRDLKFSSE